MHALSWVLIALCLSACSRSDEEEWLDIEHLAFVGPGRCFIAYSIDCSTSEALLVDRFELPRLRWMQVMGSPANPTGLVAGFAEEWGPENERYPATGMTLFEARECAQRRGMRLPTAREWMRIAAGERSW